MPQYYFHLRRDSQMTVDAEGLEFPDEDAARAEAAKAVHELLAEAIRSNYADVPETMVVDDEDAREVASVPFTDAVPAELKGR